MPSFDVRFIKTVCDDTGHEHRACQAHGDVEIPVLKAEVFKARQGRVVAGLFDLWIAGGVVNQNIDASMPCEDCLQRLPDAFQRSNISDNTAGVSTHFLDGPVHGRGIEIGDDGHSARLFDSQGVLDSQKARAAGNEGDFVR